MRWLVILSVCLPMISNAQDWVKVDEEIMTYTQLHALNDSASISVGTVNAGELKHGKLFPFKGDNFFYFDKGSYLAGRAFLNGFVRSSVLETFDSLYKIMPTRYFGVMECSNEHGGEMQPHKTHQNGLSVDFMMPLLKDDLPYYGLDSIGLIHYLLDFDDAGKYKKDPSVSVDFNLMARQILLLDFFAKKVGLKIFKVIVKIEFKDELFMTEYGKLLKASDIYVVQGLTPTINALHDDHFHVDFGFAYTKTEPALGRNGQ
jgi:penicillin-insensitive murein endopeptidase